MVTHKETYSPMQHFVGIGILLAFLLPHTSIAFLLVNPILCILFQVDKRGVKGISTGMVVVVPLVIALITNMTDASLKSIVMAITMILYYYTFPLVRINRIPNKYIYVCLAVIVVSQCSYIFHIPYLTELFDTVYPISEDDVYGTRYIQENVTVDNVFDYRMGGLYRNANLCAMSLSILLVTYIIFNIEKTTKKLLPFIVICSAAVLLTGSRTGFAVTSMIIIAYMLISRRIPYFWRFLMTTGAVVVFLYLVSSGSNQYRALNVSEGMGDSASAKFATFMYYLSNEHSLFRLLIGHIDATNFNSSSMIMSYFDSDYGNIIFCYGIIGFISILSFFYIMFKRIDKTGRLFFILLLWMVSAAIISSYRHLFIFMLLLSIVYQSHKRLTARQA